MVKTFKGQLAEVPAKIKLDLKDRQIIHLLAENCRLSNTTIAKTLKTSREVISYRMNQLKEKDLLHGFKTVIESTKLGFFMYLVYLKLKNIEQRDEYINYVMDLKEVTRVKTCAGSFDLQVILTCKDLDEFDSVFNGILHKLDNDVNDYLVLQIIEEGFSGLDFLLKKNEIISIPKNVRINRNSFYNEFQKRTDQKYEFDKKDREILEKIKLNARLSIKDISSGVSLSEENVEKRIGNMVLGGVVQSFIPMFAVSSLGFQWHKLFLRVKNIEKNEIIEYFKSNPNIAWYMKLIGRYNYQISIFSRGSIHFHSILDEIRLKFSENLILYDSLLVYSQHLFEDRLDVD